MIEINKIDLNKAWNDVDWDLFETNFTTVSKAQFNDDYVFEILYNQGVIGLVELDFFLEEKICHITEFEIQRKYRKQGLGKQAVKELLNTIKQVEFVDRIELNPKNSVADAFWKKCGFN